MNEQQEEFQISIQHIKYSAPKVNKGIQFILVLDGELDIETNSRYYHLDGKDLFVINRNQLYQIRGSEHNSVFVLSISDGFMIRNYTEYRNSRFECYSREVEMGGDEMVQSIRKLLANVMISYYRQDEISNLEIHGYISQILLILIRRFREEGSSFERLDINDFRLMQIIDFMEKNYDQMITLDEIAQKHYLSASYLSRYFKQKTGIGLLRFLMNIRLKHSMKDLLYTSNTISQIAMNNGFPNTKSFSTLFKEVHGMNPHAYRDMHKVQQVDSIQKIQLDDAVMLIRSPEIVVQLGKLLNEEVKTTYSEADTRIEKLTIDLSKPLAIKMNAPDCVLHIREITELLKEDVKSQILAVKNDLQLRYIGVSNMLSRSAIPPEVETDEAIATTSPYYNLDSALEFLRKHDLSLFVRIDYSDISLHEESYFTKLNLFLRHCLQIYGESYMKSWKIMFYESFCTGVDEAELQRVYIKLNQFIKQKVPSIQFGVFMATSYNEENINEHHSWQFKCGEYIDFIGYDANQNEVIDFEEMVDARFDLAKDYIKEKTNRLKRYLMKNHLEKPLHLVSWNTLSGNTRYTNGTFFRGALVLKNIVDIADEVKSVGFWINTQVHEEEGKNQRLRMDGIELFHYFKGKRPAYFAMMFLKRLHGSIIAKGSDYIMTQNERGYQLVLMNCNIMNPYFSIEETFLQKLNKDIHVHISGLQAGEYQIRKRVFDKDHGALYTKWWGLNSKHGMDAEVIEYIIQSSHPSLEIFDECIKEQWSFYSYLTSNAIHFFDIRRAFI